MRKITPDLGEGERKTYNFVVLFDDSMNKGTLKERERRKGERRKGEEAFK